MEKGEGRVKFARGRAALNKWIKMVGAMIELDSAAEKSLYLPVTGGRQLLKGRNCSDQT